MLPRAEDLFPALLAALLGVVPLAIARVALALRDPTATATDLWRVTTGELQAWCLIAFSAALVLRHAPDRVRPFVRVGVHAFTTFVLLISIVEVVFFVVTGGRIDVEVMAFAIEDAPQVAPVFLSEVEAWHLLLVGTVIALGIAPARLRFRPRGVVWGWMSLLLLLVPIALEGDSGRARPRKALRILQPSLIEQLWWDGLERVGDTTIAPDPDDLVPLRLVRGSERPPFNIVMVILESQGARATSVHTPELGTTPTLAALARDGWWVRNAYSAVPHTSKSIVTTLCGTWPQLVSEIREADIGGLPDRCLPALLRELGYRTAFFQTADERFERRGSLVHHLGFEKFLSRDTVRGPPFETVNYFGVEEDALLAPGIAWSTAEEGPFFAAYLTLTSHHDYGTPADFEVRDYPGYSARHAQYLNSVRYVDGFLERLMAAYRDAGLLDDTLFVILGDHGEAFGEHGRSMHDLVIWDEGLRIPMVLYGPGVLDGTGVVEGPRQQIDIVPTVLGLLGLGTEGGYLSGTSLFSTVAADRTLLHSCWRSHRCLAKRVGDRKTIDHFRDAPMQHFDLAKDPLEQREIKLPAATFEATRAELRDWRARVNGRYDAVRAREIARRQVKDDRPAVATWGGKMDLLGCDVLTKEALPAEAVWVRCRWRTREVLKQAWRVDLGLEGDFEPVVAEVHPMDGLFPTFKWTQGLAVEDDVRVFLPADARPGPATVYVGWERYGDGIIALDGDKQGDHDRVAVGTVTVLPPLYPYAEPGSEELVDEVPSEDPSPGAAAQPPR